MDTRRMMASARPPKGNDSLDLNRLCEAVRQARLVDRQVRENRRMIVRELAGAYYSENAALRRVPMNLLWAYKQIVSRGLISRNPRGMYSTFLREAEPTVEGMQTWCNRQIEKMNLAETFGRVVDDALVGPMGIIKIGIADPSEGMRSGWGIRPGQPYADSVDYDDYVRDPHARVLCHSWQGHRRRVPLETVRKSKFFSSERRKLDPTYDSTFNEGGDERISMLGRTWISSNEQEARDYVDLWEIYDPQTNIVYTFVDRNGTGPYPDDNGKPLGAQRFIGYKGPFRYLVLGGNVPGNALGLGPMQQLFDLHLTANHCLRKLIRQAERLKQLDLYDIGNPADAKALKESSDGELIGVTDSKSVVAYASGGPNQVLNVFFDSIRQAFNWMAGNLDTMQGDDRSKTATQGKMNNENSGATLSNMQSIVTDKMSEVMETLGWHWWYHPTQTAVSKVSAPTLPEYSTMRIVTPQQRHRIPWELLDIKVDPYSLPQSTPQSRSAALKAAMTQLVLPILPMLQQSNMAINWPEFFKKISHYDDLPELEQMLTAAPPVPPEQGPPDQGSAQTISQPNTPTENIRRNVPMRTEQGDMLNRRNTLLGMDVGGASSNGAM